MPLGNSLPLVRATKNPAERCIQPVNNMLRAVMLASGLVANRMNADSYQRAIGAGTVVTKGKAMEAMRRKLLVF
jgi:hypothetical protein